MSMKHYTKQYIDGNWTEGSGSGELSNYNPFTGQLLYTYRPAGTKDVDAAYAAAKAAQPEWAATSPAYKQKMLKKLYAAAEGMKDEVFQVLIQEGGSTFFKAESEYGNIFKFIDEAMRYPIMMSGQIMPSNIPGKDNYVFKVPKGVICVIAPFNFPILLALRSVIPAIACGNTVVLKPSSDTPASAFIIAEFFEKAGFPKGVVNVIAGKGSEIGDYIISHPTPSLISFTGSTAVGQHVGEVAGHLLKDVSLELGGNQAMIVLDDADVLQAAKAAVMGSYSHQGQVCMAINRVVATPKVYDSFVEAFVAEAKKYKVGNPLEKDTQIGPLVNANQTKQVVEYILGTVKAGAKVALEGAVEGNLIHPWVFSEVTNDMPTAKCEVFAPVCSIIRAKDEDDAIRIANETEYGLSNSLFTKDLYRGLQLAKRLESGMVHINDQSINDEPHVMFGGEKYSGVGRFNGPWVVNKFSTDRWISVQTTDRF